MSLRSVIELPGIGGISIPTGLFINNQWLGSTSGSTLPVINPATGQHLVDVAEAGSDDVNLAVKAARNAFITSWGTNVTATDRASLIHKLADLIRRDAVEIAQIESLDTGKGVRIVRDSDVEETISCLRYYAGAADKIAGQSINIFGSEKFCYTLHQPIGVCGQIIPWNYPLMMMAWKIAPALAAGCCIVLKPSELTPLSALRICELVVEAGFPPGVVNVVSGYGASAGHAISTHMDIDKIAFTGSVPTGRRIAVAAAESNLKKVTLELGGKSPMLVFESADVDDAANWTAMGIWFNSGQDCCASSRVYVHESIYEEYVSALVDRARSCAIGQPSDERTSFGPLISEAQRNKVLEFVEGGRRQGAKVMCGGQRWAGSGSGFWVEPTVIAGITPEMDCVREEIFGPVVTVGKFSDEAEALRLANDSVYGLAAAVFTNDTKQATRVAHSLDAGTVWCNEYGSLHSQVPFGGFKQSGIGRELGSYGLEGYCQVKAVHQNLSRTVEWPL